MPFDVLSSDPDPDPSWRVIAWVLDPADPYRPGRSLASTSAPTHAHACRIADVWADVLARHPLARSIVVEVFRVS